MKTRFDKDLAVFGGENYIYLVFTTVTGISKAPDIDRATTPRVTDCRGVIFPSGANLVLSQLRDEKYKPTPGTQRTIDWKRRGKM